MQLSEVETALAIVIGAGTIAGTVIGGIWKGRTVVVATCTYVVSWFKLPAQVARIDQLTAKELTNNGGGSMRDIVMRTEVRVAAVEARSRAILSQLHIPFWESDAEGNCVFSSRELAVLTGWSPDDTLGRRWLSTIHPDCREAVMDEWDACIRDSREFVMDYAFVSPRGDRIEVHAEANSMRDPKG